MEAMKVFTNTVQESYKDMFTKWPRLILSMFLDSVMITLMIIAFNWVRKGILLRFDAVSEILNNNPEIFTKSTSVISSQYVELINAFKSIILLFLGFALFMFLVYAIFQGINWYLVVKKEHKKVSYFDFIKRFKIVTFTYLLLYLILTAITFYISARTFYALENMMSNVFQYGTLLLTFFFIISTAYVSKFKLKEVAKRTFKFDMNFVLIFISMVMILLVLWIAAIIVWLIFNANTTIALITGPIFATLIFSYARIHMTKLVKKMK